MSTLPESVRPPLDVLKAPIGIAHLGMGAFVRSHIAIYTEGALAAEPGPWAIAAASPRTCAPADDLAAQDGLYTLLERGPYDDRVSVHGAIRATCCARREPDRWRSLVADPAVRVLTVTVTEAGYPRDAATGGLRIDDPDVRSDLAGGGPVSALGLLVAGLEARRRAETGAIAVVSCDNLSANGARLRALVGQWCERTDPALGEWVAAMVTFPATVVDRITPATTPSDVALVENALGVTDRLVTVAEEFHQWVIEDSFPAGRPAWERAGAQLVADVTPWEQAKLRLLNAGHSTLAYLGLGMGLADGTVADAMAEPALVVALVGLLTEASECLEDAGGNGRPGPDLATYRASVVERFGNPRLSYRLDQIARNGTEKVAERLVPTVRALHAAGRVPRWSALALAAWSLHDGAPLAAAAPDLAHDHDVAEVVARRVEDLRRLGTAGAIGNLASGSGET